MQDSTKFWVKSEESRSIISLILLMYRQEGFASGFWNQATLKSTYRSLPPILIPVPLKGSCAVRLSPSPGMAISMTVILI